MNRSSSNRGLALVALAGVVGVSGGAASAQSVRFQRAIGSPNVEIAYDIDRTLDSGYVLAGRSTGADGTHDMYIARTDKFGATMWVRRLNSANNANDAAYSVRELENGDFIVAGESNSLGNFLGISLTRLSPVGNVIWSRLYNGTPFFQFPDGVSVKNLSQGGVGVVGRVLAAGANNPTSGVLIVATGGGAPVFQSVYNFIPVVGGAPAEVSFTDLQEVPAGVAGPAGFLISGHLVDPQSQRPSALIVRTDLAGAVLWSRTYSIQDAETAAVGVEILPNATAMFSAWIDTPANPRPDGLLARIDLANGNVQWARFVDAFRPGTAGLELDDLGGVVVSGTTGTPGNPQQAELLKVTITGNLVFSTRFGPLSGETIGHDAIAMPCDRGYALVGGVLNTTPPPPTNGQNDFYFVKTDESGRSGCLEDPAQVIQPIDLNVRSPQLLVFSADNNAQFPLVQRDPNAGNIRYCLDVGCVADVDDGTSTGTPDGGVTIDDLLFFLLRFEQGC